MVARSGHHRCVHERLGSRVEEPLPLSEIVAVVNVVARVDNEVAVVHLISRFNDL